MYLRRFFLAFLLACVSPLASAISLGAGQLQSHIGEPFSADIAILGNYSEGVRFSQVKGAECRTSIIGKAANGCDSVFEGKLELQVGQRADGRYYLHVTSDRSDEMFYRIILKSESEAVGAVFNAFVFLPEFRLNPEPVVSKVAEVPAVAAPKPEPVAKPAVPVSAKAALPAEVKRKPKPVAKPKPEVKPEPEAKPVVAVSSTASEAELQIKKHGEYADDIYALQKENIEIEQQIVLLEKHIGLLKEVIRLKAQAGDSVPPAVAVPAAPAQSAQVTEEAGMLTWILLAAVLILSALLGWMYRKMERLTVTESPVALKPAVPPSLVQDERASLDLTGAFVRPKW